MSDRQPPLPDLPEPELEARPASDPINGQRMRDDSLWHQAEQLYDSKMIGERLRTTANYAAKIMSAARRAGICGRAGKTGGKTGPKLVWRSADVEAVAAWHAQSRKDAFHTRAVKAQATMHRNQEALQEQELQPTASQELMDAAVIVDRLWRAIHTLEARVLALEEAAPQTRALAQRLEGTIAEVQFDLQHLDQGPLGSHTAVLVKLIALADQHGTQLAAHEESIEQLIDGMTDPQVAQRLRDVPEP